MEAETPPAQPPSTGVRRVARWILWPLRRFFDPRFGGVIGAVHDVRRVVMVHMEAANETATLSGRTLDRILAQNEELLRRARVARTEPHHAALAGAYAFRALATLPDRASVAVVGSDSVDRSLTALGYDVANEHALRTAHLDGEFDAVLVLSTVHDPEQLKRLRHHTKEGGILILSALVGPAPVIEARRVYDQEGLDELLDGWELKDVSLARRGAETWTYAEGHISDLEPEVEALAMVTATKQKRAS